MMKKFLFTLLTLMLVAPLASPQPRQVSERLRPVAGQRTLDVTPLRQDNCPQELRGLLSKRMASQSANLKLKFMGSRRVDENTTRVSYSTSFTQHGEDKVWATAITYNTADSTATIEGLLDGLLDNQNCNVVTAPYVDGEITIPAASPSSDPDHATIICNYYGYDLYLYGGTYNSDSGYVDLDDEVKLYVADDLSTVSTNGKAIGAYMIYYGSTYDMANATKGLTWTKLDGGATTEISTTEIDFGELMYPMTTTQTFKVTATSSGTVNYTVTCDDSHFTVTPASGMVALMGSQTFTVTFTPGAVGTYEGKITFTTDDTVHTVTCKGVGIDVPTDFSSLVTKGDPSRFTWENASSYPWTISDGAATTTNLNVEYSHSLLTGVLDCPQATRITFDWGVKLLGQDTLYVLVDGHKVANVRSGDSSWNYGTTSFMVSSGTHAITWDMCNGVYTSRANRMSISNVQLDDAEEYELVSPDGTVTDFAMSGASNYNGTVMPQNSTTKGKFTINVNPTEAAGVSFDVKASTNDFVTITVDGAMDRIINSNQTYYYNFTEGGSHTIVATLGGFNAAINEVFINPGEYTETTKNYLVVGQSYLDKNKAYTAENGQKLCYPAQVTYSSTGRYWFRNMVQNDYVTEGIPVFGRLKDGKIAISAPTNMTDGTLYGLDAGSRSDLVKWGYYNYRYWLAGGTLETLNEAGRMKGWVSEFTMTPNADHSRIVGDTGFGVWYSWSWYMYGIVEFLKPGAVFYETTPGKVNAIADADTLNFGNVYANLSQVSKDIMIINLGDSTDFEAYIDGANKAMFTVTPTTGSMSAQGSQLFTVTYTPTRTGDHTAKLVVVTEGNEVEVVLVGHADEAPDFDSIVGEGGDYIRGWDTSSDYPWYVENGIAYSGNKGIHNSKSKLSVDFSVPEGYYARVSAEVKGFPEINDGVYVTLDDKTVEAFNMLVNYGDFGEIVDEGEHTLTISFEKGADDELLCDDQAQITNLRIRLYAKGSDVAMTLKPKYFFEELVPWDLGDSIYVTLVNKGTNALTVSSVTNAEPFAVVGDIPTVAAGDSVEFVVRMNPCDVDTYCKTLVLHTSAGDVPFDVQGTSDYVRYLGNYNAYAAVAPICVYYNKYKVDRHYCQSVYEAEWLAGLQGAQFTEMTFYTQHLGRVDFQCPTTSWNIMETTSMEAIMDNDNPIPAGLTNVYEGEQLDVEGYELTVPFNEPYTYQGGNFLYFSEQLAREPFAYSFYWHGENCLNEDGSKASKITAAWVSDYNWQSVSFRPLMRIRYIPAGNEPGSGVEELTATPLQPTGDGYTYDLMGRRVDPTNLAPGIYIRNGQKFMVK